MFDLLLVDPKKELCEAWEVAFKDLPHVKIINGKFEDVAEYDCMVSAANSYGLMDGGVDLAIINHFGKELEIRVQNYISSYYLGEQPVGTSFILPIKNELNQYLAHTPTMRVPKSINGTENVYQAMKAMLIAVWMHNENESNNRIRKIVCPGLGTSAGRMPVKEAARQMSLAYKNFLNPLKTVNWKIAHQRNKEITFDGKLGYIF